MNLGLEKLELPNQINNNSKIKSKHIININISIDKRVYHLDQELNFFKKQNGNIHFGIKAKT